MCFKVFCWNCGGLNRAGASTKAKLELIFGKIKKYDIIVILETHNRVRGEIPHIFFLLKSKYHFIYSTRYKHDLCGGILVLVRKKYRILFTKIWLCGRLMTLGVKDIDNNNTLKMSVFYGPQWGKLSKNKVRYIMGKFTNLGKESKNLIFGDFNFIENKLDKGSGLTYIDKQIIKRWDAIKKFLRIFDSFRVRNRKKRIYSFVAPQGKSRVDRVYGGKQIRITKLEYENTKFPLAHKLMTFHCL